MGKDKHTHDKPRTPVVSFVSLGCPKNVVDGENMLGKLLTNQFALSPDPADADIIIVNTCSFIEPARVESKQHIREMAEYKKTGRCKGLVVSGCLAQRYGQSLLKEMPEIDALIGTTRLEEVDRVCSDLLAKHAPRGGQKLVALADPDDLVQHYFGRLNTGLPHYSYLKISEGCNQRCAFCAIPHFRGNLKSRPIEAVVAEGRDLVESGARELILISQDSSSYGMDLYDRQRRIADLLRAVAAIDGLQWLRLMYHYPTRYPEGLIEEIAANDKIVKYVDIPLQHINDRMLRIMKRGIDRKQTEDLLARMREQIPGLVIRTTLLVGFPGETEAEFNELCDFVQNFGFDRLGVFSYSYEEGTASATMEGHLPETEKLARRDRLMEIQQQVAFAKNEALIGKTIHTIVDRFEPESQVYLGRTYGDAPDIDNQVFIESKNLKPGSILPVRITAAEDYDLVGRVAREHAKG